MRASVILAAVLTSGCTQAAVSLPGGRGDGGSRDGAARDAEPGEAGREGGDSGFSTGPDARADAAVPVLTVSDFCRQTHAINPVNWARCWGGTPEDWSNLWRELEHDPSCAPTAASVAAGRMRFDPVAAERCLAALETLSCTGRWWHSIGPDSPTHAVPECRDVFSGLLGEGERCDFGECSSGLICDDYAYPDGSCTHRCVRVVTVAEGEQCDVGSWQTTCEEGAFCGWSASSTITSCIRVRGLGERCSETSPCGEGGCFQGTCQPVLPEGSACDIEDDRCAHGSWCGWESRCEPAALPAKLGAACDRLWPCGPFMHCRQNVCALPPAIGETCGWGDEAPGTCLFGWCDDSLPEPVCVADRPIGARCTRDEECAEWSCRDGVCAPVWSCAE